MEFVIHKIQRKNTFNSKVIQHAQCNDILQGIKVILKVKNKAQNYQYD